MIVESMIKDDINQVKNLTTFPHLLRIVKHKNYIGLWMQESPFFGLVVVDVLYRSTLFSFILTISFKLTFPVS